MTLESIEQRGLIRVDDPACARDFDELDLVDFPRRTTRRRAIGGFTGVAVHALFRPRVIDEAEIEQLGSDIDPGFFERLAARGGFEILVGVRRAFRDAPRRAAVVVARGMHEQNLERTVDASVKHRPGCELGARLGHDELVYRFGMSQDPRKMWFANVVKSGLENQIFNPADVLAHATPDVLASALGRNAFVRTKFSRRLVERREQSCLF